MKKALSLAYYVAEMMKVESRRRQFKVILEKPYICSRKDFKVVIQNLN